MKLTLGEGAEEMYTAMEGVKVRGGTALDPVLQFSKERPVNTTNSDVIVHTPIKVMSK